MTFGALLLMLAAPAVADSASAQMQVSVQVLASVRVTIASQPDSVDVTEADLARGYVDVAAPIVVHARTNSRSGYLLQVSNGSDDFSAVELSFDATSMKVFAEGWVSRPYVRGGESISMSARLRLSPHATPGRYALPIAITATPL